jgi:hypothetical protein
MTTDHTELTDMVNWYKAIIIFNSLQSAVIQDVINACNNSSTDEMGDFHVSEDVNVGLLGCVVMQICRQIPVFHMALQPRRQY